MLVGCSRNTNPEPPSASSSSTTAPSTETEADRTATLNRLTQVLRRFSAEHQRVPTSLNELVTAGYLTELPAAPAGKQFVFDDQLRVTLK